jgi:hypothetical protein
LDLVEAVSTEGCDEKGRVVIESVVAGDGEEEVLLNVFILWAPDLLTAFIDDGVLMGVVSNGGGAGWSSEEMGEELGFRGDREWEVGEDGSGRGGRGDDGNGSFNDGQWEVLYWDVGEGDLLDDFLKLKVDVLVLLFEG